MEWTVSYIIGSPLFKLYIFANDLDNIDSIRYLLYGALRDHVEATKILKSRFFLANFLSFKYFTLSLSVRTGITFLKSLYNRRKKI